MKPEITQMELFAPSGIEPRRKPCNLEEIPETDIMHIDCVRGRMEIGDCEDENGVSIWDVLECLKRDGITKVKFI